MSSDKDRDDFRIQPAKSWSVARPLAVHGRATREQADTAVQAMREAGAPEETTKQAHIATGGDRRVGRMARAPDGP
jgi:hypothetical protein